MRLPDIPSICSPERFELPADSARLTRRVWLRSIVSSGALSSCVSNVIATEWTSDWQQGSWQIHADFALSRTTPVVSDLIDLQSTVPTFLELPRSEEAIHLYLFQQRRDYQRYLRRYFPGIPDRPAMYIKQRGYGMVFAHAGRDFAVDLRHEATHAVLHCVLPFVPLWLDEGLAEYFEMPVGARLTGNPHLAEVRRELARRRFPELEPLESIAELSDMRANHYRDAWAWVHFLLHGPAPARAELIGYFAKIFAHDLPSPLSLRLREKLPRFKAEFVRHFAALEPVASVSSR